MLDISSDSCLLSCLRTCLFIVRWLKSFRRWLTSDPKKSDSRSNSNLSKSKNVMFFFWINLISDVTPICYLVTANDIRRWSGRSRQVCIANKKDRPSCGEKLKTNIFAMSQAGKSPLRPLCKFVSATVSFRDCNPGLEFSIPGFGIVEFPIPGSRDPVRIGAVWLRLLKLPRGLRYLGRFLNYKCVRSCMDLVLKCCNSYRNILLQLLLMF